MKEYVYRAFGLHFRSELLLPEMQPAEPAGDMVSIRLGKVPVHLDEPTGRGLLFESTRDDFIMHFRGIASFRVENGCRIIVAPEKGAPDKDVRLFLLGSAMAALLHQRSIIPLHGSCIHTKNGALIISGASSSGKSTLAAGLRDRGYSVMADDICALSRNQKGEFSVRSGLVNLKIWKDVLQELKQEDRFEKVRPDLEKYFLPIDQEEAPGKAALDKILILSASNQKEIKMRELSGVAKYDMIYRNVFRINFPVGMGRSQDLFEMLSSLVNKTRVFSVIRPSKPMGIHELSDFVEREFISG